MTAPKQAIHDTLSADESVIGAGSAAVAAAVRIEGNVVALAQSQILATAKNGTDALQQFKDALSFGTDNLNALVASGVIVAHGAQEAGTVWLGLLQAAVDDGVGAIGYAAQDQTAQNLNTQTPISRYLAGFEQLAELSRRIGKQAATPLLERIEAGLTFTRNSN